MSESNSQSQSNPQAQAASQSLQTSDPAIVLHAADSSIRTMQRTTNVMKFIFVILAFFAVGALLLSAALYRMKKTDYANEKAQAEAQAAELKHITPQSLTLDEDLAPAKENAESNLISFSLFTTPDGADVYLDSNFIGVTPIEQIQLNKSAENHKLVIIRDGYNITRREISFAENYSDVITLSEKVVIAQANKPADDARGDAIAENVFENKGVIVNQPVNKNKKNKNGNNNSAAAPDNIGIALPD